MADSSATAATATRLDVVSPDGTTLAVWVDGEGPGVVLVHGSPSEHTTFDPLVAALRSDSTTFAMDRRGSGASGDGEDYAIEREFEDVAAVVDAAAARCGGPVALLGHSYGCNPAMGAATLTANVHRLILYEPSFGLAYPAGSVEAVERAVAAGDLEGALRVALVDTGVMTEAELDALRASSRWPKLVAAAPSLPRECRVEQSWEYAPGRFDGIAAPTLLLAGSESGPELAEATRRAAAAIPGAEVRVLDGHGHFAFKADPTMVASIIREHMTS